MKLPRPILPPRALTLVGPLGVSEHIRGFRPAETIREALGRVMEDYRD